MRDGHHGTLGTAAAASTEARQRFTLRLLCNLGTRPSVYGEQLPSDLACVKQRSVGIDL